MMDELIDMPFLEFNIDPAYEAWMELREKHSNCTYTNCQFSSGKDCPEYDEMDCYPCGSYDNPVKRQVIAEGGIIEKHRDPTQTYRLICGHVALPF